jgi:hypothetical protein
MVEEPALRGTRWRPHPDDDARIREAMVSADRGGVLSPEDSEVFLRWMETGEGAPWPVDSD